MQSVCPSSSSPSPLLQHPTEPLPRRYSYIQVPLSLLISQLAFDTDQEALEFLEAYKAAIFKTPSTRPDPTKGLTEQLLDCKKAGVALGQALTDLQKADLKGQI